MGNAARGDRWITVASGVLLVAVIVGLGAGVAYVAPRVWAATQSQAATADTAFTLPGSSIRVPLDRGWQRGPLVGDEGGTVLRSPDGTLEVELRTLPAATLEEARESLGAGASVSTETTASGATLLHAPRGAGERVGVVWAGEGAVAFTARTRDGIDRDAALADLLARMEPAP